MDHYHPPERSSRMELRRSYLDHAVRRSVSLDARGFSPQGHHYDNHSLGEESFDYDEDDQRCHSPLPCNEGCRDLLTKLMSPMISSVAIARSISLGREESPRQGDLHLEEYEEESRPIKKIFQSDTKQALYGARKSVREKMHPMTWGKTHCNRRISAEFNMWPKMKVLNITGIS
nr:hypothetical transcript [Hymenolepis microstoma]